MCAVFIPYLWCSFSPIYDKRCLYECTRKALPVLLFAGIGARLTSAITLFSVGDFRFIYNLIYGGSVFYGGLIGGILGLFGYGVPLSMIPPVVETSELIRQIKVCVEDKKDTLLQFFDVEINEGELM